MGARVSRFNLLVCAASLMLVAELAHAEVVYSNRASWTTEGGPCLSADGPQTAAHGFQTDAVARNLQSVTLQFHVVTAPVTVDVALHEDSGGQPGAQLASLGSSTQTTSDTFPEVTFTPLVSPVLTPSTVYWIVASSTDPDNCDVGWTDYEQGEAPTGLYTYVADGRNSGGGFSTVQDDFLAIEIDASPPLVAVPTLGQVGLLLLLLLTGFAGWLVLRSR